MPATGPVTAAGKAASARNATRHGLLSDLPVLPLVENQEDWEAHHAATLQSLAPVGHTETLLAERIALLHWRLARLARYEVALTRDYQKRCTPTYARQVKNDQRSSLEYTSHLEHSLLASTDLDRIQRYEAHLSRDLHRTHQLLRQFQQERAANPSAAAPTLPTPTPPSAPGTPENCERNSPTPVVATPPPQNYETNSSASVPIPPQPQNCKTNSGSLLIRPVLPFQDAALPAPQYRTPLVTSLFRAPAGLLMPIH